VRVHPGGVARGTRRGGARIEHVLERGEFGSDIRLSRCLLQRVIVGRSPTGQRVTEGNCPDDEATAEAAGDDENEGKDEDHDDVHDYRRDA
jgi:hypothetical protein